MLSIITAYVLEYLIDSFVDSPQKFARGLYLDLWVYTMESHQQSC